MHEGGKLQPFRTVALRLNITDETIISPALQLISVQMADQLTLGCYPVRYPYTLYPTLSGALNVFIQAEY